MHTLPPPPQYEAALKELEMETKSSVTEDTGHKKEVGSGRGNKKEESSSMEVRVENADGHPFE